MEDFYELLGVPEDASTDEIDQAWRERVHRYHPDVNDDTRANAQFKTLKTAHEVLSDETKRSAYDRLGHETYVEERLDGLPTARHPATDDSAGTDREGSDEGSTDDGAESSDQRAAAGGTRTGRSRTGRSGSRSRGSGRSTGDSRANERQRTATGGAARERSGSTDTRTDTTSSSTTAKRRKRPRRPLAYGWAVIALAGVVYLLGLQSYLRVNAAALSALSEVPPAVIPSVLARTNDLVAPGTFVLDAVATGAIFPLVFAAGAAGLALGFLAVVASFGHGAAYLYAVGGVAPAAALAIGPIVAAPDGAVLLLAVVIPAATVALFLIDVGKELLTGP